MERTSNWRDEPKVSNAYSEWCLMRPDELTPSALDEAKRGFEQWAIEEFGFPNAPHIEFRVNETGTYYRFVF